MGIEQSADVGDGMVEQMTAEVTDMVAEDLMCMSIVGTTLYIFGDQGLGAYDITDPAAPVKKGSSLNTSCNPWIGNCCMAAGDGVLFVGGLTGISVIDITDSAEPKMIGETMYLKLMPQSMLVDGQLLYIAGEVGFAIYDIANPAALKRVGGEEKLWDTGSRAGSMELIGNQMYLFGLWGVSVVDVQVLAAQKAEEETEKETKSL